ncbi:MAG: NADH:flavin oxidoreductase/NADH oxidase family protein [Porticoccaceae bacterium]|nr:NADH:flavin oxidoreductase/NADH oxidase family protein [Porticoccaceae bacterium]MDG1475133.1 NADH:flavin oxidoreductase/NADH oxidase family protein [Porticoccaceae bacterium]
MSKSIVFTEFKLPNGQRIKNRIVKAAMEENMSDESLQPGGSLLNLYQKWAEGGAGLIFTGNVMVDCLAMTGPGGVVLEKQTELEKFTRWSTAAKANDTKVWMQINHPGRQVYKKMGGKVYSPSDVSLDMGKLSDMFGEAQPMTEEQIQDLIQRFTDTAVQAEKAGFDGVQIHAAHGYLIAQFLSPLVNKRQDQWGGSPENRARLLVEVIKRVKAATAPEFGIGVKLNSADFQHGGFDVDDALTVVEYLKPLAIDLVELSGGSYEAPAMQGITADGRKLNREAYFLEFAEKIASQTKIPVMTTGGIRRLPIAEKVLQQNVALVGIATGLATEPNLINIWRANREFEAPYPKINWKNKTFRGLAVMAYVKRQLRRVGANKSILANASPLFTLIQDQIRTSKLTKRYKSIVAKKCN